MAPFVVSQFVTSVFASPNLSKSPNHPCALQACSHTSHAWLWSFGIFHSWDLQGSERTRGARLAFIFSLSPSRGVGRTSGSSSCSEFPPTSSTAGGNYSINPSEQVVTSLARSRLFRQNAQGVMFLLGHGDVGNVVLPIDIRLQLRVWSIAVPRVGVSVSQTCPNENTAGESPTSFTQLKIFKRCSADCRLLLRLDCSICNHNDARIFGVLDGSYFLGSDRCSANPVRRVMHSQSSPTGAFALEMLHFSGVPHHRKRKKVN